MIRLATINDLEPIMQIIEDAKKRLKKDGSSQWQDGYPNLEVMISDIQEKNLYLYEDEEICGIMCLTTKKDLCYSKLYGGSFQVPYELPYLTIHRFATNKPHISHKLLLFAKEKAYELGISSIKVDTMNINYRMRRLLEKHAFKYVGYIYLDKINEERKRDCYELVLT